MVVYVLDVNGNPMMPTRRFGKVRRLLNSRQAKIVKTSKNSKKESIHN